MNTVLIIVIVVLALLTFYFFSLYRRALKIRMNLVSLIVMVLLDDEITQKQKQGLRDFIKKSEATNAAELGQQVNSSVEHFANNLAQHYSIIGAAGLAWKIKTGEV